MFLETNHETLFPAAPHGRVNCLITPGDVILYIVYLNEFLSKKSEKITSIIFIS